MKRDHFTFIQMNTSAHLLASYQQIALSVKRKVHHQDYDNVFDAPYGELELNTEFIGSNLTLLNLNASILEGTLRTLMCEVLQRDSESIGELAIEKKEQLKYSAITRSYFLIKGFQDDVEFRGGWDNLKRQYRKYLSIDLDKILTKDDSAGINAMFTLRNVAAHGTALVMPKEKVTDEQGGTYLFKWQSKLQGLTVYIGKKFDMDYMDALSHPLFAKHFMDITKELLSKLGAAENIPPNTKILLNNIEKYCFGYIYSLEWVVNTPPMAE